MNDILQSGSLEGRKDDTAKIRYELLPPEFLEGTADILTFGAAKYGDRNWEKGMAWGRVFAALMRHMWAWWRGEPCDAETGKSHLWHAACCLAFLMAYEQRGVGTDDRPEKPTVFLNNRMYATAGWSEKAKRDFEAQVDRG